MNAPLAKLPRRFVEAGKPVAAVCGATYALAAEGLLDDVAHTSNMRGELQGYGGASRCADERVMVDGGIITAGDVLTDVVMRTFRLYGAFLDAAEVMAKPVGLTAAWWQVLGAVLREPLPVSAIAREMGLARIGVRSRCR